MARHILSPVSSRRLLAFAFLALALGILAADKWSDSARISQTGDDVAIADTDLSALPVMYE